MTKEVETRKGRRFLFFVGPAILYAGLIFYLSGLGSGLPKITFNSSDKILHMIEFFILGWLLVRAFHFGSLESISRKLLMVSIFIGILYGASDEIHQYFVPARSSDIFDWLADCIGVILGALAYQRFHRIERKLTKLAGFTVKISN